MGFVLPLCVVVVVLQGKLSSLMADKDKEHDKGPCAEKLADISAFPGEEKYEQGTAIYTMAYSHLQPAFVAFPKTAKDVQRCLNCSFEHSVPCTVKSGGHSNAGYSTIDGSQNGAFVINLAEINQITILTDNHKVESDKDTVRSVRVQAGAKWGEVYSKVDDSMDLILGGMCATVGVAGFSQGGGYSLLVRKFGLSIDSVLSVTMVTANGSDVVVTNSTHNTDLFWALRGGGGGNFGVVVDFTYLFHPPSNNYVYGALEFESGTSSRNVLAKIGALSPLPRELYLQIYILPSNVITVLPLYYGPYSDAVNTLEPLLNLASSVTLNNYTSYTKILEEATPTIHKVKNNLRGCLLWSMNDNIADIFFKFEVPKTCEIGFIHLGGAVTDKLPTETAYFHRDAEYEYYCECFYSDDAQKAETAKFQNQLYETLNEAGHCVGNYVSDIDRNIPNWQHAFYGDNYERLVKIKELWNPIGVGSFHFLQEIGSKYNPGSASDTAGHCNSDTNSCSN